MNCRVDLILKSTCLHNWRGLCPCADLITRITSISSSDSFSDLVQTQEMASSEEFLKVQDGARHAGLIFCSFVLFLHGAGIGAGLGYAGLVLPHHVG